MLSRDLPQVAVNANQYGLAGDYLPYSARPSASLGFEQDVAHFASATAFLGADFSYIGARPSTFATSATTVRAVYPSYTTLDMHASVVYQQWLFNLFANNLGAVANPIG